MTKYVALMRGINVGGRNRVPMAALSAQFEAAGARSVRTYIQSGNVVFDAEGDVASIRGRVREGLRDRLEVDVPIVLRTADELAAVLHDNPFLDAGHDPKELHVGFLLDRPSPSAAETLDADRSDVDRFALIGRELYLHVPGGMARTRLTTAYFDRCLDTVVTVRNWRTVTRLAEMSG